VAPRCIVATVEADAAALPPRQLVQLHVEAAPPGVEVTVAGCGGGNDTRSREVELVRNQRVMVKNRLYLTVYN